MTPIASAFTKIHIAKGLVWQISKNPVLEHSLKAGWQQDDTEINKISTRLM